MLVVGDDDVAAGTVGVNRRGSERPERGVPLGTFADDVAAEVAARRLPEAAGDTGSAGEH